MRNTSKKYIKQAISRIEKNLEKQNEIVLGKGLSYSAKLVLPDNFWDKVNLNNTNRVQEVLKHAKIQVVSDGKSKTFSVKKASTARSLSSIVFNPIKEREKTINSLKNRTDKKIEGYKKKLLYGDEKNFNISVNKSTDDIVKETLKQLKITGTKIPESKRKAFNKALDKNIKDAFKIEATQNFLLGKSKNNKFMVTTEKITYEGSEQIDALLGLVRALERQRKKNEDIVSGKTPALAEDISNAQEELNKNKSLSGLFILNYVKRGEELDIPSHDEMTKILKSKKKFYGASVKEQREYRWKNAVKGIRTSTKNAFSFSPELAKYTADLLENNWDKIDEHIRRKILDNSSSYFFSSDSIGKISILPDLMALLGEDMDKKFKVKGYKDAFTVEQIKDMIASGELE